MAGEDWVNRLFQGGDGARGLSGSATSSLTLSESGSFYNFRLRRHFTAGIIAEHPDRVWLTHDDPAKASGLAVHVAEALADERPFSDVLIVLSGDDWDDAFEADPAFDRTVASRLGQHYAELRRRRGLTPLERPLGVWLVREGSEEVGGTDFGLLDGEFVTGLLPNLYRQPGSLSEARVAVHVNLPGVWDGYREVGRVYDDQVLFTLGAHFLDNFSHPTLREPALFGLRVGAAGVTQQVLNPEIADRYQLHTTEQDGVPVITLATLDGQPLAYVVLWALDEVHAVETAREEGHYAEPEGDVGVIEAEDLEPIVEEPVRRPTKTILPETYRERIFTLQERGALLQKVHFSAFMLGYDVFFGARGEVGTAVRDPAAAFQVRKKTVSLLAHADGVTINGEPLPRGQSVLIDGDAVIEVGTHRLEFRELRQIEVDGWPYVGEIRRAPSSQYLLWGREDVVGRSRECRVVLPDEPDNSNIVWKPKIGEGGVIHTKNGDIPKAKVYTDSIMVASEHAAFDLRGDVPYLVSKARNCHSYIRRGGHIVSLYPTQSGKEPLHARLEPGDEVLVGNCLFQVSFTPIDAVAVAPAPAPTATQLDDLASAVSVPNLDELDAPPPRRLEEATADRARAAAWADLPDLEDEVPLPPPRVEVLAAPRVAAVKVEEPVATPAPAAAAVRPAPAVEAAPAAAAAPAAGQVLAVSDADARFELARPARLVLEGWAVNGEVALGNHDGAELVVPESRFSDDQAFAPVTYARLFVRGKKARLDVLTPMEVRVDGHPGASVDPLTGQVIAVIRRDDAGDEDFAVELSLADTTLPDPRARLLQIDRSDALVDALFTLGFPLRQERTVSLGGGRLTVTALFDASVLRLSDYLASYRTPDGFLPVFVQHGGGRFYTAPEDGSPVVLAEGDRLIVDRAVYRLVLA